MEVAFRSKEINKQNLINNDFFYWASSLPLQFKINSLTKRRIMMKKGQVSLQLMAAFLLFFAALAVQCTKEQPNQQDTKVKEMTVTKEQNDQQVRPRIERTITGEIAKGYRNNGYIIRSKVGTKEIFTVLNPEPKILDEYIKSGKIVDIEVQVVTGDNIEIQKIDGKEYFQDVK
jgi:hypothetical protein